MARQMSGHFYLAILRIFYPQSLIGPVYGGVKGPGVENA